MKKREQILEIVFEKTLKLGLVMLIVSMLYWQVRIISEVCIFAYCFYRYAKTGDKKMSFYCILMSMAIAVTFYKLKIMYFF